MAQYGWTMFSVSATSHHLPIVSTTRGALTTVVTMRTYLLPVQHLTMVSIVYVPAAVSCIGLYTSLFTVNGRQKSQNKSYNVKLNYNLTKRTQDT